MTSLLPQVIEGQERPRCTDCGLHSTARSVCIPLRGAKDPIVLFVGEAPNKTEDWEGKSFLGKSGEKLAEIMKRVGLSEEWCGWTNIVKCIPWEVPGKTIRSPSEAEKDSCSRWIEREILTKNPVFVVPLGNTATSYFLGDVKISQARGRRYVVELPTVRFRYNRLVQWLLRQGIHDQKFAQSTEPGRIKAIERAVVEYGFKDVPRKEVTIFPTWHPAAILYGNEDAEHDMLMDLNYIVSRILSLDSNAQYKLITNFEEAVNRIRMIRQLYREEKIPYLSYDLETTSLDSWDLSQYITTIGFSWERETGYALSWDHHESPFKNDFLRQGVLRKELNLTFAEVPVVGHNVKYDVEFSWVRGIHPQKIYDDSELMSWSIFNDQIGHDLDSLTSKFTDLNFPKQEMKEAQRSLPKAERYNTDNYDLELVGRYNCADVDATIRLVPALEKLMRDVNVYDAHKYYTVGAIIPTIEMEINGVPIDQQRLEVLDNELRAELQHYYDVVNSMGVIPIVEQVINIEGVPEHKRKKFSIGSPEHLAVLLFDVLKLRAKKYGKVRKKGKLAGKRIPSTDKHVLAELFEECNEEVGKWLTRPETEEYQIWMMRLEIVKAIREYKRVSKQHSSYVKNMPGNLCDDGYLRCSFGIRHTESGRFNCKDPSLHTIPWHSVIKKMFVSRWVGGLILSADHAQMELRVFAMATRDEQLIQTFREGKDIHRMIAARVLGCKEEDVPDDERRRIKTVVFGLLYGRGAQSIAAQEGISVDKAKEIIAGVFRQFPRIRGYIDRVHQLIREQGWVPYLNGFRRVIPVDADDPAKAQRQAVNTTIQGPASDLAVAGMINMHSKMNKLGLFTQHWEFKHDDLAYDIAPGELLVMARAIQTEMVGRPSRQFSYVAGVPLKVDFELGVNWGSLVEMKLLEGSKIQLSGEEDNIVPLINTLQTWIDEPIVASQQVEVKKKTAVVRSLMKSTGEKIDYNHHTVVLDFPNFVRREPQYKFKPMVTVSAARNIEA